MSRATARQAAMQLVFEHLLGGDGGEEAVQMVYEQLKEANQDVDSAPSETEMKYIDRAMDGIAAHQDEIDELISGAASGWTIERMSKVDLTILRLAVFEILYCADDVPGSVAINEAVKMAKTYSEPASGRFVNGILGTILRQHEDQA